MAATESTMMPLGTIAPPFDLPEVMGGRVTSADHADERALLVMFICNHCPYVKHVRAELARLGRDYEARGIAIVGISSNDAVAYPADSFERMREEKQAAGYPFPCLYDETQDVARAYGAACTPDFFVFDADRKLVYRGQLDDSRPGNGRPVTGRDVRSALDAVLEGRAVSGDQRPSLGCSIKWKRE
jgi:peroxiredoxin